MGTSKALQKQSRGHGCYVYLACSIGSMSLACGSLMQIPNTTDRITLQRGLCLTSLGFIYFISLTDFCNKYLLETQHGIRFRRKYRLMMSDVMEITNKIVSAIQAAFSFLVGFIVCKSTCSKSFVYASHFLMEAYGWFGTAYFMYDIWSMYKVHTQKIADKLKLMRLTSNAAFMPNTKNGQIKNGGLYDKHIANTFGANGQRLVLIGATTSATSAAAAAAPTTTTASNGIGNERRKATTADDVDVSLHNATATSLNEDLHLWHHEDEIYDYDGESVQIPADGQWGFLHYVLSHPVMMIHHIFIGTFGLLVVTYIRGGGHCIYSYMFMMEFSTPFVSLRSILSTLGLKDTRVYILNGLAMLATFFICRVFMWPFVMWRYSVAIDATFWQAVYGLPRGCIISILILFLPQVYWFFLMVKGALKVFFPAKSKTKHHNNTNKDQLLNTSKNNNLSPLNGNIEHAEDFHKIGKRALAEQTENVNGAATATNAKL